MMDQFLTPIQSYYQWLLWNVGCVKTLPYFYGFILTDMFVQIESGDCVDYPIFGFSIVVAKTNPDKNMCNAY